mgnify:CR=1 FL=1
MKTALIAAAGTALALLAATAPAQAQDNCTFEGDILDFEQDQIDALYACVSDTLAENYAKEGHEIGSVYREWQPAATGPFAPGPHGNRFLNTFANDIAYDAYVEYGYGEDFAMPVGSILAKESYKLRNNGNPRPGPLFIMTKVAAGEADEFDNWVYDAVQPNGKTMKIKQSFCHNCHTSWEDQDSLAYPLEDVRVSQ